jgi:hypothetical protein
MLPLDTKEEMPSKIKKKIQYPMESTLRIIHLLKQETPSKI